VNYEVPADRVVALVNVGARYSSINILKGGRSTFTGDVPVGGRDITEALMRDLDVSADEADALKAGGASATIPEEQVAAIGSSAAAALIEEIHHALSFLWTAATDENIDIVYLSGGVAQMPGLAQQLSERVLAPVEVANPFSHVSLDRGLDAAALRHKAPEFAVAMGLATRRASAK
jgi:type IV pilus assembly protein PilM